VKVIVFAISGLLAGLAALLHAALVNQGSHIDGNGYELNAIAAVVIGGTSLAGGVGTVAGSMIGALTLSILDNILGLRNIQSEYQAILKGVIIVLAVVMETIARGLAGAAAGDRRSAGRLRPVHANRRARNPHPRGRYRSPGQLPDRHVAGQRG
jgi:ribose/xylose/arabinose/galactoside ABC-type transport system permease subunit